MDRKAPKFDKYLLVSSTERAKRRVNEIIKRAKAIEDDTDEITRRERHLCISCHYERGLAGAACTSQPCACCASPQMYGSTNTDVLCVACAKEHTLCKHCGGDLEMRTGRKDWPVNA